MTGVLEADAKDRVLKSLDPVISKEDWQKMIFSYPEPIHYLVDGQSPTPKRKTSKADSLYTNFKKAKTDASSQPSTEGSVVFPHGLGASMHSFTWMMQPPNHMYETMAVVLSGLYQHPDHPKMTEAMLREAKRQYIPDRAEKYQWWDMTIIRDWRRRLRYDPEPIWNCLRG